MKIKQMLYDWRRCLSLAGAAAAVLFSTSCKDDPTEEVLPRTSTVCFEPSVVTDDWNTVPQTRSGGVEEFPIDTTYVIEVPDATPEGEPLYVHVEVRDGIDSPTLKQLSADAPQTRGSQITGDNFHDSFAAYAYAYNAWSDDTNNFNLMNGLKVEKSKGWATEVEWPRNATDVVFYGYAPHQDDVPSETKGITIKYKSRRPKDSSDNIAAGDGIVLEYAHTLAANTTVDLVVGGTGNNKVSSYSGTGRKPEMSFHHPFAAIKVKAASDFDRIYLTTLGFISVAKSGTLTFNVNYNTTKWSDVSLDPFGQNVIVNAVYPSKEYWVDPGQSMLGSDPANDTFFAVPQTLNDKTEIQILYNTNGHTSANPKDHEERHLLIGKDASGNYVEWRQGKTYTYTISKKPDPTWSYTFEVAGNANANTVPEIMFYNWEANTSTNVGTKDLLIKSFAKSSDSNQRAHGWSYEYSTNDGKTWTAASGGTISKVLEVFGATSTVASSGDGTTGHKVSVTVAWPEGWRNSQDEYLRSLTQKDFLGTAGMFYDLSTGEMKANGRSEDTDPKRNTANCYVINAPGYFRIPLVWGNAVKNGQTNESAYKMTGSHQNCKATHETYKGNAISSPWILQQYSGEKSGCSAKLQWEDVKGLITNLAVDTTTGSGYITFQVNGGVIKQGNALISLLDSKGSVMWSWHLWITPYKPAQMNSNSDWNNPLINRNVKNMNGQAYEFMAIPLGHCIGATRTFPRKSILLKFIQNNSKLERKVRLTRYESVSRKPGYSLLYQYGRPFPFPGGIYDTSNEWGTVNSIPVYTSSGTLTINSDATGSKNVSASIMYPTTIFHHSSNIWLTGGQNVRNRWDMACRKEDDSNNNGSGLHTIKSVYDPSPHGYSLPTRDAFSGFCTNGHSARGTKYLYWRTPYEYLSEFYSEYGARFLVQHASSREQTLFLPTTGKRDPQVNAINSIFRTANMGRYWTATYSIAQNEKAYSLYFGLEQATSSEAQVDGKTMEINTRYMSHMSELLGVIPVKD